MKQLISFFLSLFLGHFCVYGAGPVTVFVHGSACVGLTLVMSPRGLLRDNISPSCVSAIKNVRLQPAFGYDQAAQGLGLQEVNASIFERFYQSSDLLVKRKDAISILVPAYDHIARAVLQSTTSQRYFTYGFMGLLSHSHRQGAAQELYDALCSLDASSITLVTHSHGGNVALLLAEVAPLRQKKLSIDSLIMFAPPVQAETALLAASPIFRQVINCYSEGDRIQVLDYFSTQTRRSVRVFGQAHASRSEDKAAHILDVKIVVNRNGYAVGHANMWLLGEWIRSAHQLYPLPLMIYTPVIRQLCDRYGKGGSVVLDINTQQDALRLSLKATDCILHSADLDRSRSFLVQKVQALWEPRRGGVIFNEKNIAAARAGLQHLLPWR